MKRNSKTAGISLVALVITIIVLIILTGAVIVTFMEGGIIDRAKESVFKNDMRTYQEILALKRAENQMEIALGEKEAEEINASTLAEIQKIIPEFKEEYEGIVVITDGEVTLGEKVTGEELSSSEELYATWLGDLGIGSSRTSIVTFLKVGDYVEYVVPIEKRGIYDVKTASGEDETGWLWNDVNRNWRYDEEDKDFIEYDDEIKWRVLKNNGKTVTLVSDKAMGSIMIAKGKKAFVKGADRLDEICQVVYGGRNLKIEDVNELLKGDREWGNNNINWQYNDTNDETQNVPAEIKTIKQLEERFGTIDNRDVPETGKLLEDYEPNYYTYNKEEPLTDEEAIANDLIFLNGENYFLSSTAVNIYLSREYASFGLRVIANGKNVTCSGQYMSLNRTDMISDISTGLRPVVTLNSNIKVTNSTLENVGKTADTAWKLK